MASNALYHDAEKIINDALGYNSPVLRNGNTSPGQGRSIRDYEEQLRTLQKENFNLKLRIYILEEKNPGCSANSDGSESLFKQNVDLKVAIESLRKELQEKQAVLEQAVTAFNLMESNQKEMELKYKDQIEQLNQQNQFLQMEIKAMDRNDSQDNFNDLLSKSETDVNATQKVAEIQESLKELENKNIQLVNKLSEYEWNLKEKDDKVNQLEATIDKITYENATMKEQVDNKEKARNEAECANEITKKYITERTDKIIQLTAENSLLKSNFDCIKTQLEHEKLILEEKKKILQDQHRLLQDQHKAIAAKDKNIERLKNGMKAYESHVVELMRQRSELVSENSKLKEAILRIEHAKLLNEAQVDAKKIGDATILQNRNTSNASTLPLVKTMSSSEVKSIAATSSDSKSITNKPSDNSYDHLSKINCINMLAMATKKIAERMQRIPNVPINSETTKIQEMECKTESLQQADALLEEQLKKHTKILHCSDVAVSEMQLNDGKLDVLKKSSSTTTQTHNNGNDLGAYLKDSKKEADKLCADIAANIERAIKTINGNLAETNLRRDPSRTNLSIGKPSIHLEFGETEESTENIILSHCTVKPTSNTGVHKRFPRIIDSIHLPTEDGSVTRRPKRPVAGYTPKKPKEMDYKSHSLFETSVRPRNYDYLSAKLINLKSKSCQMKPIVKADSASDKVTSSCSLGRQHDIQLAEIKRQLLEKTTEHEKACVAIQLFYKEVGKLKRENESLKQSSSNSIGTESMKVKEEQSDVTELRAKVERLQIEADDANLLYSECSKLCATLTLRLEELAMFLDSLLTHKNIFGGLTPDRQSAIRRAINHSLEMSRSINNMSMMSVTGERSTLEMSAFMNMSCENKENIMSAKLFENLRDDVATLRNELEISVQRTSSIDPSLSRVKKRTSQHNESQSEAEEWSEPDRNVSLARIGLESGPKTALRDKYESNESSGSKPTVSEEKLSLSSKKQLVYKTETRKLSERVTQLELDLAEKQLHLEQYEAQAKVRNDEWKKDRNLMKELKTELESMGKTNKQLIQELENAHLKAISTNPNDSIVNNLEIELKEKTDKIKHLLNDNETLVKRLQLAEKNLEEEQKKFNKNLKEQQERMEILMLQQNDRHRDEMEKKISEFQKTLARDWVSKSIYDEELHRVRELDVKLKENLIKMEYLEDHEKALQQQVASSAAKYEKLLDTREKLQVERNQFESQMKIIQQKHDDLSLEKIKLNSRIAFLENANAMLQKRLIMGPQGGVSSTSTSGIMRSVSYSNASKYMNSDHHSESMSGYTSEEFQPDHKRLDNSSPDLGIESGDSQVKTVSPRNALQRSLEISQSLMNILKEELSTDDESPSKIMKSPSDRTIKPVHDCEAIENENLELKRKLLRTRKAFMDTWNNLKAANLQKERVVNDIRHQVQLTHKVLKQAKGLQADKKV